MQFTFQTLPWLCAAGLCLSSGAFAAHPLITEDTGTQGTGKFQLEANTEHGYQDGDGSQTHTYIKATTLSYGVRDDTDLMFTVQHTETTVLTDGELDTSSKGFNDAALDVKWRFYEKDGISYGFKPGITFANGDKNKGLGAGRTSYSAALFTSIETQDPWLFHAHLGYKRNRNDVGEKEHLWHLSACVWRKVGEDVKLVANVGTDTNADKASNDRPRFIILGAIYSPRDNLDLDVGIRKDITGPVINYAALAGLTLRW